jgi:general secretion pathway protein G
MEGSFLLRLVYRRVVLKTFVTYFELENIGCRCAFIRYMRILAESEEEFRSTGVLHRERPWFVQVLRGLIICAAVIFVAGGFLLLLIIPNVSNRRGQAKVAKAKSDLATFRGAIDQFRLDCDRYPTSKEGFAALRSKPTDITGWHGPYLQKDIGPDPWGNPYHFESTSHGYVVESFGADGKPGGAYDDADILDGSD